MKELPKVYEPQEQVESSILRDVDEENDTASRRGLPDPTRSPTRSCMPPPNVTGQLHMGHALDSNAAGYPDPLQADAGLQRAVAPRHDHAGIATQIKVEEELREE